MIDFTNCKVTNKAFSGANGHKLGIVYNNEHYMLKFPSNPTKQTELSYANGCISEYISCHIYEMLGIPVQKTLIGTYTKNNKEKIVVACKDFTSVGIVLQDFGSIKNQIIDSDNHGYGMELSSILEAIEQQNGMDAVVVKERFWEMFIVDAMLGNFDRHNGNWGFLYNQMDDTIELAPVYDCGSCLYPQADKEMIQKILSNQGERNTRIYNFPVSAIKENGKKIMYYKFLLETDNEDCINALMKIYPRINMQTINAFIDNIECIDDLQKKFYKTMLSERYKLILTQAVKQQKEKGISRTNYFS